MLFRSCNANSFAINYEDIPLIVESTFVYSSVSTSIIDITTGILVGTPSVLFDTPCEGFVAVTEIDPIKSILLYPNPTDGVVNVVIDATPGEELRVEITSTMGQILYSETFPANSGGIKKQINLSAYSKGIYYVRAGSQYKMKVEKLIIF